MDNDFIKPTPQPNQSSDNGSGSSDATTPPASTASSQPPKATVKGGKKSFVKPLLWVLVTLVLMAGSAYAGYKWENKRASNVEAGQAATVTSLNKNIASLQAQVNKLKKNSTSSTSTSNTTTVVKLTQLGVEITVPNSIKDLSSAASTAKVSDIGLSTASLTTADKACTAAGGALGTFSKVTGTYPTKPTAADGTLAKQLTGYYIAYSAPQTSCSTSTTVSKLATTQETALKSAFSTIAPIQ